LKGRVGTIAFDLNFRPGLWESLHDARATVAPVIALADILRASREDAEQLFGAVGPTAQIQALRAMGAEEIALTLDAAGCFLLSAGETTAIQPPRDVKVRDTTGAGDCFNGAYLARRLLGDKPVVAARAALVIAARKLAWAGAIAPALVTHPKDRRS
jgi:2-dehydro-3-deoxygluconokinase